MEDEGKIKGLTQDARTAEQIAVSKMEGCWASTPSPTLPRPVLCGSRGAVQLRRCSTSLSLFETGKIKILSSQR